eukprot:13902146-Heterocapsa_arctica.AAC.1
MSSLGRTSLTASQSTGGATCPSAHLMTATCSSLTAAAVVDLLAAYIAGIMFGSVAASPLALRAPMRRRSPHERFRMSASVGIALRSE